MCGVLGEEQSYPEGPNSFCWEGAMIMPWDKSYEISVTQGTERGNQVLCTTQDLLSLLVITNLFPSSQPARYYPLDLHAQPFDDSPSETGDSL